MFLSLKTVPRIDCIGSVFLIKILVDGKKSHYQNGGISFYWSYFFVVCQDEFFPNGTNLRTHISGCSNIEYIKLIQMEGGGSKKVHLLGTSPKRGISCQNFSFFFVWHIAVKFWGHT